MTYSVLTQITISFAGFLLLAWNFLRYQQDNYRTDIRRIRDDLFDAMVAGKFDFMSKEYGETRQTLNGMLLLSGSISNVKFILIGILHSLYSATENASQEPSAASPELRIILTEARTRAFNRMMSFLFLEGVTGVFCRSVYWAFSLLKLVQKCRGWMLATGHGLMKDFLYVGDPVIRRSIRMT